MEVIHAKTYEEAWREVCRRRKSASGPAPLYRIVKSPYAGFDIVAVDPELYADALAGELIDGLPTLPRFGKGILRGL